MDNFAVQWLRLQNVKEADPDGGLFPNFTRNLGQSMTRETKLLFDSIVREDRSLLDLLTADYTFVDEVLAKHYGIPGVDRRGVPPRARSPTRTAAACSGTPAC